MGQGSAALPKAGGGKGTMLCQGGGWPLVGEWEGLLDGLREA